MVAPISVDLRQRITAALDQGETQSEIAERFFISQATVCRIMRLFDVEGHLISQKPGGNKPILSEKAYPIIKDIVLKNPDMTLPEVAEKVSKVLVALNILVLSNSTIYRVLKKLKLNRKKSRQAS